MRPLAFAANTEEIITMNRLIVLLLLFCGCSSATCFQNPANTGIKMGEIINVDLSDKLNDTISVYEQTYQTAFKDVLFCSILPRSSLSYQAALGKKGISIGFNKNTQIIKIEAVNVPDKKDDVEGPYVNPSELNESFTLRYTLFEKSGTKPDLIVENDKIKLDTIILSDVSGLNYFMWLTNQGLKFIKFIRTGIWPKDERDMYLQQVDLKYLPRATTCRFENAGLTVTLPAVSIMQVRNNKQPGYTPFNLNFTCQDMQSGGNSSRAIDMFLSSNHLHVTDAHILTSHTADSARGIGLKLVSQDKPDSPITLAEKGNHRGNATSLFSIAADKHLERNFTLGMGVYYAPYLSEGLTNGRISTSATLHIVYP